MKYAIIGSGKIGTALARIFARKNIEVGIANSRGPETLAPLANELGPNVVPQSVQDAHEAEIIFLAVPYSAHNEIAKQFNEWGGKIIVDATNAFRVAPEELGSRLSSEVVAEAFVGAYMVKAFNHLPAGLLGTNPSIEGQRQVILVSSNDAEASATVAALATQLGFAPIELGSLDQGGVPLHVVSDKPGGLSASEPCQSWLKIMNRFEGKLVVVTGAGSGMGQRTLASPALSTAGRSHLLGAFLAAALLMVAAYSANGAELSPETLAAWNAYVQAQNARVSRYSSATPFLWSDESPDRLRRLHNAETVVAPFGGNPHRVPYGLVHHWIAAAFLPGTRLAEVLSVVRDYGEYRNFCAPNVVESHLLRQTDTQDTFSVRMLNKAVVAKFALDAEFQDSFRRLDDNKCYGVSYTTRVRKVENYGMADEHEALATQAED